MKSKLQRLLPEVKQYFNLQDIKKAGSLLKPYIYKHRKAYIGLLFFLLIEIFLTIAFAWFMGNITNAAIQSNFDRLRWLLPLGVSLTIVSILSTFFTTYFETAASSTLKRDLKTDLYKHILLLPANKTANHHSGELLSHFTNDIHNIDGLIGSSLIQLIRLPLLSSAAFIYLTYISWQLTVLTITLAPLALITGAYFGLILRRNSRKVHKLYSDMNTLLNESFQGLSIIRSFTMEKIFHKRYSKQNNELYNLELENTKMRGWFYSGSHAISSIAYLVNLSLGAYFVSIQQITVGSLLIFLNLMGYLLYPLSGLAGLWASFQHSITAIERISSVLDYNPESTVLPAYYTPSSVEHSIAFKNVTFGYEQNTLLFDKLNLNIPAGKVVALVGHSGAGKTSLFNLLLRFYKPQTGDILIDGVPIKDLSLSELRSAIALVPQESFLFDGSIKDNLQIARPDISEENMIKAAHNANIHDFIISLPDGYDTDIGERGVKLSGGQKQRIAIARALLKDAPILLLDEATSALDSETEYYVKVALERLMKNRTTIVIAHRLSTIQNADLIVVMNEGKIVQTGRHEELINQVGFYRNLHQTNFEPKKTILSLASND
ncbi:ABC transporter ATP-binding protein [Cytobacillus sp. S13-E01]|uniref:ABC transporter ATP-binding protein n=1 Tax=Cytobacillus sp. S13-E01 TaxID=3031326 RepID=UPI0023D88CCA|nr:ABC transporter ATP-binding protein [Cytobacillus sp. S13-E01]MDF0727748.1 ABC transporter ATP-binding protein [Cytobacillus sp. S13-E01]